MDGNRRFAQREHVEKKVGHAKGYDKLKDVLEWCLELGVRIVTVYAFSIENFKRPRAEVDDLMSLAVEKFSQIAQQGCGRDLSLLLFMGPVMLSRSMESVFEC